MSLTGWKKDPKPAADPPSDAAAQSSYRHPGSTPELMLHLEVTKTSGRLTSQSEKTSVSAAPMALSLACWDMPSTNLQAGQNSAASQQCVHEGMQVADDLQDCMCCLTLGAAKGLAPDAEQLMRPHPDADKPVSTLAD